MGKKNKTEYGTLYTTVSIAPFSANEKTLIKAVVDRRGSRKGLVLHDLIVEGCRKELGV